MNKKILAFAVVMMTLPVFATGQSVYKWTDENGVTHFGDRKPTGKQSESVSIRTGKKSDSGSAADPGQAADQAANQEGENTSGEEVSAAEEARQKQRAANCKTARSNLSIIASGSRIKANEDGETRYLTPEEIAEKRKQFEEIAELNCGDAGES